MKAEKLRNALILERKKYCSFVSMWAPVIAAEIDLAAEMQRMKESQTYFSNLAASTNNIPTDAESLISVQAQERTYVQIQGGFSSRVLSAQEVETTTGATTRSLLTGEGEVTAAAAEGTLTTPPTEGVTRTLPTVEGITTPATKGTGEVTAAVAWVPQRPCTISLAISLATCPSTPVRLAAFAHPVQAR